MRTNQSRGHKAGHPKQTRQIGTHQQTAEEEAARFRMKGPSISAPALSVLRALFLLFCLKKMKHPNSIADEPTSRGPLAWRAKHGAAKSAHGRHDEETAGWVSPRRFRTIQIEAWEPHFLKPGVPVLRVLGCSPAAELAESAGAFTCEEASRRGAAAGRWDRVHGHQGGWLDGSMGLVGGPS
jgi:hypothetical protein